MRADGLVPCRWLVAGALLLCAAFAAAQETRIGYVNMGRIESESPQFARAIEALKKEFAPREQQIVELQKQVAAEKTRFERDQLTLSETDRQVRRNAIQNMMRKSDQLAISLGEDLERRKAERSAKLFEEAGAAVKAVAEAAKLDLILQQATFARPGIDITDQVLKEMARRAGKP